MPSPPRNPKRAMLADLNDAPPESDGEDCGLDSTAADFPASNEDANLSKNCVPAKDADAVEAEDADPQTQNTSMSREEKVISLKAGLIHVTRKLPKNAHSHFLLGLMYQRLGQIQKAISAFEKSSEILSQDEVEVQRPDLVSLVQIHHAQCVLQASTGDSFDKELEAGELEEILIKLNRSVELDIKQAGVWNHLGAMLLRTGRLQSAISVLSTLSSAAPDYLDSLANLGIAYLQSGDLELAAKCFQDLVLKDQNHPAALMDYAAVLLCQYGSIIAGPGACASKGLHVHQEEGIQVAKACLLTATKLDPRAVSLWVNLANACYLVGEHRNSRRSLEQAVKLEPTQMAARFALAMHRIKDAEESQNANEQLLWAANEMIAVLKDADPAAIDVPLAWGCLAMAHRAQHEIPASFESPQINLTEVQERSIYTLKQAIQEEPDDAVHWHQLGHRNLCTMDFSMSAKFFKAALARRSDCGYAWSNLGVALHLSKDPSAETVYRKALSLSSERQAHVVLSNLGNLHRQHGRFEHAKRLLTKSLELCPGYAPANNNLGLVLVAEGKWDAALLCFQKALESDPLLDAAKSNMAKAMSQNLTS